MIGVIFGQKGSGKTKHILDMANKAAKEARGSIVFIDDDNSYMFDLNSSIRFINAKEYQIVSPRMLYGFLCGLAASDFDLEYIYIDGLMNFIHTELPTLSEFFDHLDAFAKSRGINVIMSVSGSPDNIPEFMKEHMLQLT